MGCMDRFFNQLYREAGEYQERWDDVENLTEAEKAERNNYFDKTTYANIWAFCQCGRIPYCDENGQPYLKHFFD